MRERRVLPPKSLTTFIKSNNTLLQHMIEHGISFRKINPL